jgi:hypothetical protein
VYPLQVAEDKEVRKFGFAADRVTMLDDEVDDEDEGDESTDVSSDDDRSEEEEGEGETLGHLSKSSHSFSLRDWSEDDDDDDVELPAALEATTLHVAATAAAGGRFLRSSHCRTP